MESRSELARLISQTLTPNDESALLECAGKTRTFSSLVPALRATRLLKAFAHPPEPEGAALPRYLIDLFSSCILQENILVLVPNLINTTQLPLMLLHYYLQQEPLKHIVWVTDNNLILTSSQKAKIATEKFKCSIKTIEAPIDETFNRGEGCSPTIDVVNIGQFEQMLKVGTPLSRVSLVIFATAHDMVSRSKSHQDWLSYQYAIKRIRNESNEARPRTAFICTELPLEMAITDIVDEFRRLVGKLEIATMSKRSLDELIKPLCEAHAYLIESAATDDFVLLLQDHLKQIIPTLLENYVESCEYAAQNGLFKSTSTSPSLQRNHQTPSVPIDARHEYLNPLLPFHWNAQSITTDFGTINPEFTRLLSEIEPKWSKSTAKATLNAISDICCSLSLITDLGVLEAYHYLTKCISQHEGAISKRSDNPFLVKLRAILSDLSESLQVFYKQLMQSNSTVCRSAVDHGRSSFLMWMLKEDLALLGHPTVPTNENDSPVLENRVFAAKDPRDGARAADFKSRLVVFVSNEQTASLLFKKIENTYSEQEVVAYPLGEEEDDTPFIRSFFCDDATTAVRLLIATPQRAKLLEIALKAFCESHPDHHPRFIRGASFGPYRNSCSSHPVPKNHPAFSPGYTHDAVTIIHMDSLSVKQALNEWSNESSNGSILVVPKTPSFSLFSQLESFYTPLPALQDLLEQQTDLVQEQQRLADSLKSIPKLVTEHLHPITDTPTPTLVISAVGSAVGNGTATNGSVPKEDAAVVSPYVKTMTQQRSFLQELLDDAPSRPDSLGSASGNGMNGAGAFANQASFGFDSILRPPSLPQSSSKLAGIGTPVIGMGVPMTARGLNGMNGGLSSGEHSPGLAQLGFDDSSIDDMKFSGSSNGGGHSHLAGLLDPTRVGSAQSFGSSSFASVDGIPSPTSSFVGVDTPQPLGAGNRALMELLEGSSSAITSNSLTSASSASAGITSPTMPESTGNRSSNGGGGGGVSAAAAANGYGNGISLAHAKDPFRSDTNSDPISLLHIYFSRHGTADPEYVEVMCGGVDHARQYQSTCTLSTGEQFLGWGTRKKDAKKAAAAYALEYVTGQKASNYFNSTGLPRHRPGPQGTSFTTTSTPPATTHPLGPNSGRSNNPANGSTPRGTQSLPANPSSHHSHTHSHTNGSSSSTLNNKAATSAAAANLPPGYAAFSPAPDYVPTWLLSPGGGSPAGSSSMPNPTSSQPTAPASSSSSSSPLNANGSGSATSTSAASSGSSSHLPVNSIDAVAAANAAAQASALTHANPIGAVNEFHQKRGLRMPAYHDAGRTSGPDHEPSFLATVTLYDGRTFEARGTSKKDAKTNVALKVANALGLALRP